MGDKKKMISNLIGVVSFAISFVVAVMIMLKTGSGDIWYDEVFSVAFVQGSLKDIIVNTAMDVHPPLYYLYLKLVTVLCPFADFIVVCKVASFLPLVGLYLIAAFWIRKRYGLEFAGLFALLITLMPQLAVYYIEIRMYSFALLLITGAGCCAVDIMSEKSSKSKWITFFVLGVLTAYTQYFACVAIIALYILILIVNVVKAKKNEVIRTLVFIGLSIAVYIPWLPMFYKQVKNVSGSYWIQPMTLRSIPGCLKYMFLPISGEGKITFVVAGITIVSFAVPYILLLLKKEHRNAQNVGASFVGIVAISFMVIIGFAASIFGSPIFTYRYMIPAMGLVFLGVINALHKIDKKYLTVFLLIACLLEGYYGMGGFMWEEGQKAKEFVHAKVLMSDIPKGSIIIANFDHVATISSYYLPESQVYVYEGETDKIIGNLFHGNGKCVTDEDVKELVSQNENVFFLGSFVSRDEIVENWSHTGISSVYEDECLIERYWINIYKLGLENEQG